MKHRGDYIRTMINDKLHNKSYHKAKPYIKFKPMETVLDVQVQIQNVIPILSVKQPLADYYFCLGQLKRIKGEIDI